MITHPVGLPAPGARQAHRSLRQTRSFHTFVGVDVVPETRHLTLAVKRPQVISSSRTRAPFANSIEADLQGRLIAAR